MQLPRLLIFGLLSLVLVSVVYAQPSSVEHVPSAQTFGEARGVTQREPEVPREDDVVDLFFRVSFQFAYDRVAVYFTLDGSEPMGTLGNPSGSTQVHSNMNGLATFVRNETTPEGVRDWWKTSLPVGTRLYNQTIRYKISAWNTGGGVELLANSGNAYTFVNKLAWPGAGAGSPNPSAGYPPVSFWKEEAMVGNNYYNAMLDQNGTIFDIFYPGAGAVQGVGTKNEGYVDGGDTFPAFTSGRGQMHVNQYMAGLRVDGLTYWMSNQNGLGYTDITQSYVATSNTVVSSRRMNANGNNISIQQIDFAPKLEAGPIGYPQYSDGGTQLNRGLHVERFILTNSGGVAKTVNFYYYGDWAINGGDGSDGSYYDTIAINGNPINAMIAYDNAGGGANSRGEYNPTFFPDYAKNVSVFLGSAMKQCNSVGGASGMPGTDGWRDTSSDSGQGWIGRQITLQPGVPVEIDVLVAGGFKPSAGVSDVGDVQIRPAYSWFLNNSMQSAQTQTDQWWSDWLASGVTVDTPDDDYDKLFKRGLLATALHIDGKSGALVAGYHNGAYPFCWPRDAVYGAVCMARTGHIAESSGVYTWMRDVCYRDNESWGKGFWKQKYTTDGYVIWSAPQIDETAVFPWGVYYHWLTTGDNSFLSANYNTVRDAAYTCSSNPGDSNLLPYLNYNATERLMWSNNVWEDSYGFFIYSNANVVRGLRDATSIASALGNAGDAADFSNRSNTIQGGLDDKLNANAEITDISQLGIVYPFRLYLPTDSKAVRYIDRINGVQNDTSGNSHPLVNFTNRYHWQDLINRYWGDGYWGNGTSSSPWGAGPWFLSTMWYGLYYAERADYTANKTDIDNHKYRLELLIDRLGPAGFGAEQIAPYCADNCPAADCPDCGSLTFPGQSDFVLQTAWPNAWESMSTFVDAIMAFLDFHPDASSNSFRIDPKLPTGWSTMTFSNLYVGGKRFNVRCDELPGVHSITFTNVTGGTLNFNASIRVPAGSNVFATTLDCTQVSFTYAGDIGRVLTASTLPLGIAPGSINTLRAYFGLRGDFNHNGAVDVADIPAMVDLLLGIDTDCAKSPIADMDSNGLVDGRDLASFVDAMVP